jgi:hypothetical protein
MLKMPPPPKIVRQAFNEGLSNFFVVLRSPVKVLWLQAYILALEEIPDSKGTQNAQLIGWKFFAEDADGKLASGQIATLRNGNVKMRSLSEEPEIADRIRFLKAVEKIPRSKFPGNRDYELRLLRIPSALTDLLWLKSPPGQGNGNDAHNLVIPFHTLVAGLVGPDNVAEVKTWRVNDAFEELINLASVRLADDGSSPH